MKILYTVSFILLFPFFAIVANPNTVILRDGTRLQGEIIDQDQIRIHLKTLPSGEVITVPKDRILKILYKDPSLKNLANQKKEEEERRKEYAELYSKAITPLMRESIQNEESNLLPSQKIQEYSLRGALVRSFLFPGWGQYYQGRTTASIVFGGAVALGIGTYYRHSQIYGSAVKDLRRFANPFSEELVIASSLGVPGVVTLEEYARSQFGNFSNPTQILLFYPVSPLANQRQAVEKHKKNVDQIGYGVILIWFANLLDVYFNHPSGAQIGLEENLETKNWKFSLSTESLPSLEGRRSTFEHRFVFSLSF